MDKDYVEKKSVVKQGVKYTLRRYSNIQSFVCDRCNGEKKSKNVACYINDGKEMYICNGCYGNIMSK